MEQEPQVDDSPSISSEHSVAYTTTRPAASALSGGFGGGCMGLVFGIGVMGIGLILCCTGIGAILGIPLLLGGLVIPFIGGLAGGVVGANSITGNCPYCGHNLTTDKRKPGLDCNACNRRIIVRDDKFFKAESLMRKE